VIDVQDGCLMLLGAGSDQQVGDRHAMLAERGQLELSCARNRDCLGICAKLVKGIEIRLDLLEVGGGVGAVQHLVPRDRAEARLAERAL
jgi:hypothetical protein